MSGIFIAGTDTGVGKTFVTILLARYLIAKGWDISVMKPISTGPASKNDAPHIKKTLRLKDPLELINPIRLKLPLAPYSAAKLGNKKINIKKIFGAYKKLSSLHDLILVEGIGGALVPITGDYFVADLIKELNIPAIIVARAGLGTINHTLLTIEALKRKKVEILGVIMNGYKGNDLSEKSNAKTISKISRLPVLAEIKWQKD